MELLLKNKMVFLLNCGYINVEDINIPIKNYEESSKYFYRINRTPLAPVVRNGVPIPKELLNTDGFFIEIHMQRPGQNTAEIFKSDKINLNRAVLLGGDEETTYPASLASIHNDIKDLKASLFELNQALEKVKVRITNLEEEGDLI